MTSSISSKPAHVKKIIAGHRPLAPVGIMPCARPGPPPSEGLEQHRSSPGSSHPDDDFHRTSGILTRHFHRREALRLCSRPARQDSNLTGADRLAPPGKHLLRAHMMRPRHRRDICIRRQRLFQCPRLRLRRPAPAQHGLRSVSRKFLPQSPPRFAVRLRETRLRIMAWWLKLAGSGRNSRSNSVAWR